MISVLVPSKKQLVVHVIHSLTKRPLFKLKPSAHLHHDLGLDAVDVVEIIWELEKRFHQEIPDALPLQTIGDFINFLVPPTK